MRLLSILLLLMVVDGLNAAVPYPPPTQWKGITYSPRRHTYFRMLYDWYNVDCGAGCKPVYQMVDDDLTMLSANGFNLVHLYLWDRELLIGANNQEPAGFCSYPAHPSACGLASQWSALNDFVTRAEAKGLFVALHFANGKVLNDLQANRAPVSIATEFAAWAKLFIDYLTPAHQNVLLWGLNFALGPEPGQPNNGYSQTWGEAYKLIDQYSRAAYSNYPQLGLIGVNLPLEFVGASATMPVVPRNGGYQWNWQKSQRTAKTMRDVLQPLYGNSPKDPDIYMVQLYTPHSGDSQGTLAQLTQASYDPSVAINIPVSKLFGVEFATSSSVKEPWLGFDIFRGNDVQAYSRGDSNTPTMTPSGHQYWLNNALCAYSAAGIQKLAYWSLYDPYTMWSSPPWNKSGVDLAWNGYWGLGVTSGNRTA